MSWFDEIARWYLVSLAASLCAAPFTAWLFRRLPGYGAFFARPVGLLAVVWPVWLLASISPFPYRDLTLIISALAVAMVCWGLAFRYRFVDRDWVRPFLAAEGVFIVAFLGYLWFRGYTPIITGTEKPMDSAFLSSTIRVSDMPPADPWMAGETINYYYLGYLLNGSIARVAGLPGWVAFNLALATVFAMSVTAAAGLAWGIVRTWLGKRLAVGAGVASAFLIMIAGNMRAPIELIEDREYVWNTFWFQNVGWQSSRVIVDTGEALQGETINEFPSFSFILGDLHPHVLALPFTIVALALAASLYLRGRDVWNRNDWRGWAELAAISVVIGSLYPMNSWDFPTYLGALAIALLIGAGLTRALVEQVAAIGVVAVLAWLPFWVGFVPFAGGSNQDLTSIPGLRFVQKNVALYTGERTSAGEYLTVWGITWTISTIYLIVQTMATWPPQDAEVGRAAQPSWARGLIVATVIVVAVVALAVPAPVIVLAGIPFALALRLVLQGIEGERGLPMLVSMLYAAGWAITILTEFFFIRDGFNGRFNTLFKIYYQVWTLVGVAGAIAIVLLWQRASRKRPKQALMATGIVAAVVLGLVYPITSTKTWIDLQNPDGGWIGLDGLSPHGTQPFLIDPSNPDRNSGESVDDVAAIRWLQENAQPDDVVLEAPGCGYSINFKLPTSRFSAFTGVPTVIGWNGHEGQWRGGQPELENEIVPRAGDVSSMFEDSNPSTNPLFEQYGITLMAVGDLEKYGAGPKSEEIPNCDIAGPYQSIRVEGYPGPGWELVYDGTTKIYRRTN